MLQPTDGDNFVLVSNGIAGDVMALSLGLTAKGETSRITSTKPKVAIHSPPRPLLAWMCRHLQERQPKDGAPAEPNVNLRQDIDEPKAKRTAPV